MRKGKRDRRLPFAFTLVPGTPSPFGFSCGNLLWQSVLTLRFPWRALEAGDPKADAYFARFVHLRILDDAFPSERMRGWNLYVLKQRGIFPNTLSREPKKGGGWTLEDVVLTDGMKAEIDARLAYALSDP